MKIHFWVLLILNIVEALIYAFPLGFFWVSRYLGKTFEFYLFVTVLVEVALHFIFKYLFHKHNETNY